MLDKLKIKKIIGYFYKKKILLSLRILFFNFYSKCKSSNFLGNLDFKNYLIPHTASKKNVKFLICTISGDNFLIRLFDNLFFIYLKCLSVNVKILKCGKTLTACNVSNYSWISDIQKDQKKICNFCNKGFETEFNDFKDDIISLRSFLDLNLRNKTNKIINKINRHNAFEVKGIPNYINSNVKSAFVRYNGSSIYTLGKNNLSIIKSYYFSAIIFNFIFIKILNKYKFNRIICHHGIYIPHGIINSIVKIRKICSYFWQPGYRKNSVVIVKNDNVHNYFPPKKNWYQFKFTKNNAIKIRRYIHTRVKAEDNWLKFNVHNKPFLNFKNDNPTYLLPLNVDWDAFVHFDKSVFDNMFDFLEFTVEHFKDNIDKNLIIRAHPAELLGNVPSAISVGSFLKKKFGKLPKNIKFISSFSSMNTYELAKKSDVIIVYSSKIAIELASMGKPILVVGEAWIKNKNITFDIQSKKEFLNYLNSNINYLKKIAKSRKNKALKFAYYYFFLKMYKFRNIEYFEKKIPRYKSMILNKTKNLVIENKLLNLLHIMIDGKKT